MDTNAQIKNSKLYGEPRAREEKPGELRGEFKPAELTYTFDQNSVDYSSIETRRFIHASVAFWTFAIGVNIGAPLGKHGLGDNQFVSVGVITPDHLGTQLVGTMALTENSADKISGSFNGDYLKDGTPINCVMQSFEVDLR